MNQLSRIPMPARVVIVLVAALLLTLLLMGQNSSDVRAAAATSSPISGTCKNHLGQVIPGDVTIKGRENTYAITSLKHSLTTPFDEANGQASGSLQNAPVVFTTNVSRATPRLVQAQVNNEDLTACTFNFWKVGPNGVETNYFRIELADAHVVAYHLNGEAGGHDTVTFSLTYRSIKWTYVPSSLFVSTLWQNLA